MQQNGTKQQYEALESTKTRRVGLDIYGFPVISPHQRRDLEPFIGKLLVEDTGHFLNDIRPSRIMHA